jgi:hypothetical protein
LGWVVLLRGLEKGWGLDSVMGLVRVMVMGWMKGLAKGLGWGQG